MAVNISEVRALMIARAESYEELIDQRLRAAISDNPISQQYHIQSNAIPWSIIEVLWPKYRKAGWHEVQKIGENYYRFIHQINLSTLLKEAVKDKEQVEEILQERAIKV